MRTGTFVRNEEVVAIVLADIPTSLTYTCTEIKAAIYSLGLGDTNIVKDFLDPSASTTTITRNVSNRRRKCCTVTLDKLTPDLRDALREGRCDTQISAYTYMQLYMCLLVQCAFHFTRELSVLCSNIKNRKT